MGSRGFGVRLFEIQPDGALEPILGVDEDYFCGVVPNVGDTYAMWHLHDVYDFYSVQRRVFVDSHDGAAGWCVVVRKLETAPPLENVVTAWAEDTRFWADIDEQERQEEIANQERIRRQEEDRLKHEPRHRLHPREVRALRYMINRPDCNTIDLIPRAGEHTISVLVSAGLVRAVGKDHRGLKTLRVTKEGKAEVDRHDKWSARPS
ncbi:hypothetical protein [Rhizobium favelukesii]|uniref:Uncharacterized protein n=1 Tax=Rhizobium favelukesii TaxID=348824 RepID=W6REX2_9HYPH|nr:hypothetical protein [Rhizobium favelukesii]MCS0459951.1 hypothetical protein [Rhizobium favelukesii]CDM57223.1 hypothetical protein LPU83_1551 [Rhizobium favelukesii]